MMIKYCKKSVIFNVVFLIGLFTITQVNARIGVRKSEVSGRVKDLPKENVKEKFSVLLEMSTVNPLIPLLASDFKNLIIKSPKNYSAIVVITDEEMKCKDCDEAVNELNVVAQSYISTNIGSNSNTELFFIRLDYYDASSVLYNQIKLYHSTPYILYFPTDSNFGNIQVMDFKKYDLAAEDIAAWIRDLTGVIIRHSPQVDDQSHVSNFFTVFCVIFLLIQRWNVVKSLLVLESVPVLLVGILIIFLSGQVYNHVHGAAFVLRGSSGLYVLHPNSHNQTILESFLIFILISTGAFGLILLISTITDKRKKKSLGLAIIALKSNTSSNSEEGIGEIIGAACFFGAVYGLLFISNAKMT